MPASAYLGIDIAKATFTVCLQRERTSHTGTFDNTRDGCKKLSSWLKKRKISALHACLEATGHYGEAVAEHLHAAGHTVSVVNPASVAAYRRATRTRTKTDQVDAALLADYCQRQQPAAWTPPDPARRRLRELGRRRASLLDLYQQEANRLDNAELPEVVLSSLRTILATIKAQLHLIEQALADHIQAEPDLARQHALLDSIPGIGPTTATALLAEVDFAAFPSARQLAAYAGLTPSEQQSGTSVHGPAHLSKHGQVTIRRILFMPARVAKRHNPTLRTFAERLNARGKAKLAVTCAVMRKLLHLCYGVIRSGRPFDPEFHSKPTPVAPPVAETEQAVVI
jgi:transposase